MNEQELERLTNELVFLEQRSARNKGMRKVRMRDGG